MNRNSRGCLEGCQCPFCRKEIDYKMIRDVPRQERPKKHVSCDGDCNCQGCIFRPRQLPDDDVTNFINGCSKFLFFAVLGFMVLFFLGGMCSQM